jgi:hypothetical protein
METARRILKRACSAQVVQAVFFEKAVDLGGWFWRGFGSGQPALNFRREIVRGSDGIDFEASLPEKLEKFADGKRTDVRRIAENFPRILIGGTLGMLTGVNILNQDGALSAADASHFAQDGDGLLEMMESETANDHVEAGVFERKMLRVRGAEGEIGDATLLRALFGDGQHGVSKIDGNDFASGAGEGFRDVARTGGDVQDAFVAAKVGSVDEALDAVLVGDPGIRSESLRLRGERFADDVVVSRHKMLQDERQGYHRDLQRSRGVTTGNYSRWFA